MSVMIDGAEALLADRKAEVVDYRSAHFCLVKIFKHWCDLWIFFSNKNLHNYPVVIKCTLSKVEKNILVKHFWFWHLLPGWEGGGQWHRDGHPWEHRLGPDQDRHPDQDVLRPVIRRRLAGGTLTQTVLRTPQHIVHLTLSPPGDCGREFQCESGPWAALAALHVQRQPLHHRLEVRQRAAQGVLELVGHHVDYLLLCSGSTIHHWWKGWQKEEDRLWTEENCLKSEVIFFTYCDYFS